ncbi:MAG: D-amino-acid transaminase [Alphaproteobacteria bacterium]
MSRYAYVNGVYVSPDEPAIAVEDRGFQFADSVYEVIALINGQLCDKRGHLDRLERSLRELRISAPVSREELGEIINAVIDKNQLCDGAIYIQISRGVGKRDFLFPDPDVTKPTLVVYGWPFDFTLTGEQVKGTRIVTGPDLRWARRDIKTTALLAQSMAKQQAVEAGADDCWMVDGEGFVTEATSSNAWIVIGRKLITRKADHSVLKGVTRNAFKELLEKQNYEFEERSFTPEELYVADEAFATSATQLLKPVIEADGHTIKDGAVGPICKKLIGAYAEYAGKGSDFQLSWSYDD